MISFTNFYKFIEIHGDTTIQMSIIIIIVHHRFKVADSTIIRGNYAESHKHLNATLKFITTLKKRYTPETFPGPCKYSYHTSASIRALDVV